MITWIIRRLFQACFVVLAMTVIVFVGVHVIGNPVDILISPEADQAERARIITSMGLDQPLWRQYAYFLWDALHGDLGRSFVFNEPALLLIAQRMPATMELAVTAVLFSMILGVPLGLYAGLKPDGFLGRTIMAGSILGFSLPSFWVGLMLIMVFAVQLGWLPSTGRGQRAIPRPRPTRRQRSIPRPRSRRPRATPRPRPIRPRPRSRSRASPSLRRSRPAGRR